MGWLEVYGDFHRRLPDGTRLHVWQAANELWRWSHIDADGERLFLSGNCVGPETAKIDAMVTITGGR